MKKNTIRTKSIHSANQAGKTHRGEQDPESDQKDLQINITEVGDHKEVDMIDGSWILIAFKNPNSFAIATTFKALKVIDDNIQVYYKKPPNKGVLYDIIYIDHLDCYFLYYFTTIFRKDIDGGAPYPFLDLPSSGSRLAASMVYSKLNQRLFIVKDKSTLVVVDLERKSDEISIRHQKTSCSIENFGLVGQKENKIVCLMKSRLIYLYSFSAQLKKICSKFKYEIEGKRGRDGHNSSLAVSEDGRHILVERVDSRLAKCSRLLLFGVKGRLLIRLATLDEKDRRIDFRRTLCFWGGIAGHVLFFGVDPERGFIHLYDFDRESRELRELGEKGVVSQEEGIWRFERVESKLYCICLNGKVMVLSLSI